jgi:S-formylglutathione hydrolase FrmB
VSSILIPKTSVGLQELQGAKPRKSRQNLLVVRRPVQKCLKKVLSRALMSERQTHQNSVASGVIMNTPKMNKAVLNKTNRLTRQIRFMWLAIGLVGSVLVFSVVKAQATAPARMVTECGHVAQKVKWDYCITRTGNSHNEDIVYVLHGAGGDESTWTRWPAFQDVRARWEKTGFQAPIIVALSFGPIWLLADPNSSPHSGLFDVFTKEVMPYVEQRLLTDSLAGISANRKRRILGFSMGGFNGSQLILKMPRAFKSAVLACPGLSTVSPFASRPEIDSYISRTGANKDFVNSILTIAKDFFPDEAAWQADSPLRLAQTKFGATSPAVYVSCGRTDEGGFYEGSQAFANSARTRGADIKWESLAGGHCVMNAEAIADFLSTH